MLTNNQAADIFARIKKHSTADEVEVFFSGGKSALTRFANNVIHQNVAEENYAVSVRTVFGGRTARSTTNKLDDESLKRVVESSESLAKVQHPDPDLLPLPDSNRTVARDDSPTRHFAETAAITPAQRAESVEGVFNSRGLTDWHTQTSSEISITMLAPDSSGWQKANSPNVASLDGAALAEVAARKAVESAK